MQIQLVDDQSQVQLAGQRFGQVRGATPEQQPARRAELMAKAQKAFPYPLAGSDLDRVLRDGRAAVYGDVLDGPDTPPAMRKVAQRWGHSFSQITVPLIWEGRGVGAILVFRRELGGFLDKERALLETFADQAVIAIENVRLFNETQEALEQQTASADILRVISGSPTDVQPVFDAIVTTAVAHLGCDIAIVQICSGDTYSPKAMATPAGLAPVPGSTVMPVDPEANFPSRAIVSRTVLHVRDWSAVELPAHERVRHEQLGLNSSLYLPLLRGDACVGVLVLGSREANGFTEKAVALAESFRDQAVIAIENVRLFNETKEALEQQTATAEVLQVISGSMADARPVFERILDSCERLFGTRDIGMFLIDDQQRLCAAACRGNFAEWAPKNYPRPAAGTLEPDGDRPGLDAVLGRHAGLTVGARVHEGHRARVRQLHRRGGAADVAGAWHRHAQHHAYAAAAHHRQGARAAADLRRPGRDRDPERAPVQRDQGGARDAGGAGAADGHLRRAAGDQRIADRRAAGVRHHRRAGCLADRGALLPGDAPGRRAAAAASACTASTKRAAPRCAPPGRSRLREQHLDRRARDPHSAAWSTSPTCWRLPDDEYAPVFKRACEAAGFRSGLSVPMVRDQQVVGAITVNRAETGLYADKEVALLQTFARQAVVAIENVRLFNETREALEQQRTSAEVLKVISNSVADTAPVFEAIGKACQQLFAGDQVVISLVGADGQVAHAAMAVPPGVDAQRRDSAWDLLNRGFPRPLEQAYQAYPIRKRRVVHYPDMVNGPGVPEAMRQMGRDFGNFSMLIAPMLWEDQGIGTVHVVRQPPRPFSDKESTLLASFADQAVIAIQNARLFNETKEALEQQTATAEVLQVISSSVADAAPVFDKILESCRHLFRATAVPSWSSTTGSR